jgi:hypothetical protein
VHPLLPFLATGSANHILLHLTILITLDSMYKPRSTSLCTSKEQPVKTNGKLKTLIQISHLLQAIRSHRKQIQITNTNKYNLECDYVFGIVNIF